MPTVYSSSCNAKLGDWILIEIQFSIKTLQFYYEVSLFLVFACYWMLISSFHTQIVHKLFTHTA